MQSAELHDADALVGEGVRGCAAQLARRRPQAERDAATNGPHEWARARAPVELLEGAARTPSAHETAGEARPPRVLTALLQRYCSSPFDVDACTIPLSLNLLSRCISDPQIHGRPAVEEEPH